MLVVDLIEEPDDILDMEGLQELEIAVDRQFRGLCIFHRDDGQIGVARDFREELTVQLEFEEIPHDDLSGLVGGLDALDLLVGRTFEYFFNSKLNLASALDSLSGAAKYLPPEADAASMTFSPSS